tara:strand:- start:1593 stop:1808 length:216 start_codon:yes stop_codon:yes gene_type:complete
MEIRQIVNAGHLSRVLVYDRHPDGACINLVMQNSDEVTVNAGEDQLRALGGAIEEWLLEKYKERALDSEDE